jgi:Mn2+/Fe2+ NRAMP family transporter
MMGIKQRHFSPLENISLEELVAKDHFYRRLDAMLDLSFVRELVAERYSASSGRPSVDPVVFFGLQLLTGIIGIFIAVACAATLATVGRHIEDARDAAQALRPLAGDYASLLFGMGLAGAGLLAAAIVPLATAYSLAEGFGKAADLDDTARADRLFYGSFSVLVGLAAAIVSLPHLPLLTLIYFSQIVNAILLALHLVLLVLLSRDTRIMGNNDILSTRWAAAAWLEIVLVVSSVLALGVVSLTS